MPHEPGHTGDRQPWWLQQNRWPWQQAPATPRTFPFGLGTEPGGIAPGTMFPFGGAPTGQEQPPTRPITRITPHAQEILQRTGGVPEGVTVAPQELPSTRERVASQAAIRQTTQGQGAGRVSRWEIEEHGGYSVTVGYDSEGNVVSFEPMGLTPGQGLIPPGGREDISVTDAYGNVAYWNERTGDYDYPPGWGQAPSVPRGEQAISPFQQAQLDFQQQQFEQSGRQFQSQQAFQQQQLTAQREQQQLRLQAEKEQRLATLRANPASWLEYAALSGEAPTIQPWMWGLLPQEQQQAIQSGQVQGNAPIQAFPGQPPSQGEQKPPGAFANIGQPQINQFQVGQPIPGFTPGGDFSNLPELINPSAQYLARLSPSSRQQFAGYRAARTGQTAQDVAFRQWSQAPPSGQFGGLRRTR